VRNASTFFLTARPPSAPARAGGNDTQYFHNGKYPVTPNTATIDIHHFLPRFYYPIVLQPFLGLWSSLYKPYVIVTGKVGRGAVALTSPRAEPSRL